MAMIDVALRCIARGWHVFPCKPRGKEPMVAGGFKAATTDPGKVRSWWLGWPDANVGIATGASGLTVLDIDHGINDRLDVDAFCDHYGVPETYTVRTGRRPEFGVQMYFSGEGLKSIAWEEGRCSGDVRGATGYVMAEGSYHPSGAFYEALVEAPIAEVPPFVKMLRPRQITGTTGAANPAVTDDGNSPITAARNVTMISILGRKRAEGYDDDRLREFAIDVNASRVVPPLGEEELERLITNACKYPVPEPEPEVLIGGKPAEKPKVLLPKDWRENYHTFEEMRDVPPPEFLIEGFLLRDSITALAAPVAQRKSIIALNVAHSLCTGEPLFDYFKLTRSPSRVLPNDVPQGRQTRIGGAVPGRAIGSGCHHRYGCAVLEGRRELFRAHAGVRGCDLHDEGTRRRGTATSPQQQGREGFRGTQPRKQYARIGRAWSVRHKLLGYPAEGPGEPAPIGLVHRERETARFRVGRFRGRQRPRLQDAHIGPTRRGRFEPPEHAGS